MVSVSGFVSGGNNEDQLQREPTRSS